MTRYAAVVLLALVLTGCSSPAPTPVRTTSDQQLFGPTAMRLHPVFTKVSDFDSDGQLDGIEAVLEFQDQFGDPTKASGRVLFDIYQFAAYNPDPRGVHLAGPFEGRLDSMQDQRARWNRVNRAYIFQLAYPPVKIDQDYVITATFERTDGGRFLGQMTIEGEHIRPGTPVPPPIIRTLPSTQSSSGQTTPGQPTPSNSGQIITVPSNNPSTQEPSVPATATSHEPPPRTDQP